MNQIRLEKITYQNVDDVLGMRVAEEQKSFVASNSDSLVEAYLTLAAGRQVLAFGIYDNEMPVGFVMIGYDYQDDDEAQDFYAGNYLLWRLMIDQKHQGKGYGKEAVRLALDLIRTFPCGEAEYCWLSYEPENEVARALYREFGFEELSEMPEGWTEVPALLKL